MRPLLGSPPSSDLGLAARIVIILLGLLGLGSGLRAEGAYQVGMHYQILPLDQEPSADGSPWISTPEATVNIGFLDEALWVDAKVQAEAKASRGILLEIANPRIDHIEVYRLVEGRWTKIHQLGDTLPFSERLLQHRNFLIPVNLDASGRDHLRFRITNRDAMIFVLKVHDRQFYLLNDQKTFGIYAAFYGGLGCLALYTFAIFFLTRDRSYLLYAVFLLCSIHFQGVQNGTFFQWLWPNAPAWQNQADPVSVIFLLISGITFTIVFLGLPHSLPWTRRVVSGIHVLNVLSLALCFILPYRLLLIWAISLLLPYGILVMYWSGSLARQGHSHARFYLFGWLAMVIGAFSMAGLELGWFDYHPLIQNAVLIGNLVESLIFAFALARKIKLGHDEQRSAAQRLALERERHILDLDSKVKSRAEQVQLLLDNLDEGIFTLVADPPEIRIETVVSPYLVALMGRSIPPSRNPIPYLFEGTNVDREQQELIRQAIFAVSGEEAIAFELNAHLFPSSFTIIDGDSSSRYLEMNWKPLLDNGYPRRIVRILVALRDMTGLRSAENQAREESMARRLMEELLQVDPKRSQFFLHRCIEALPLLRTMSKDMALMFLHTVKGEARSLGLRTLSQGLHDLEDRLRDPTLSSLSPLIDDLAQLYQLYQQSWAKTVPLMQNQGPPMGLILCLKEYLQSQATDEEAHLLHQELAAYCPGTLAFAFRPLLNELQMTATRLRKETLQFHLSGQELILPQAFQGKIGQILSPLLTNCVDHGIEAALERRTKGKNLHGSIYLTATSEGSGLLIVIRDDGRGLNLEALRRKAQEQKVITSEGEPNPQALAELIFAPNISTSDSVSLYSGRGVGLTAVKTLIEEEGGTITVRLEEGDPRSLPFSIVIHLPYEAELAHAAA